MKKTLIVFALCLSLASVCFAVDPLEGYWLSIDDKTGAVTGGWEVYMEGGGLRGRLVSSASAPSDVIAVKCKSSYRGFPVPGAVNQMKVVGTPWIFGLTEESPGRWTGGNVIDPTTGNMYKCKLVFHAAGTEKFTVDTLEMRGEIGLGIGRSQFWKTTDKQTAESLYKP